MGRSAGARRGQPHKEPPRSGAGTKVSPSPGF